MTRAAIAIALLLLPLAAGAQTSGRFSFQPVEGGLMRLDTDTGQVSLCTRTGESYACRAVADDRAALQEEIDRLRRENEALRQAGAKEPGLTGKLQLPTEQDIDKAMGLFETMMRRMLRTFKDEGQTQPNRL